MPKSDQQPHTNKPLDAIEAELAREPEAHNVEQSFSELMDTVTDHRFTRIPEHAPQAASASEHETLMSKFTKIMLVSVPTLAVVLLVVANVGPRGELQEYDDLVSAALGDEADLSVTLYEEDTFTDLDLSDPREDVILAQTSSEVSAPTSPSVPNTPTPPAAPTQNQDNSAPAVDVEDTLAVLDDLFAEDDIDDTDLNDWFSDTSSSDNLFDSYDI